MLDYLEEKIIELEIRAKNESFCFSAGQLKAYLDIYDKLKNQECWADCPEGELSESFFSYEDAKNAVIDVFEEDISNEGITNDYFADIYIKIAALSLDKKHKKDCGFINKEGFDEDGVHWDTDWEFIVTDKKIKEI